MESNHTFSTTNGCYLDQDQGEDTVTLPYRMIVDTRWFHSNVGGKKQKQKSSPDETPARIWHQVIDVEDAHQERGRQQGERPGGAP